MAFILALRCFPNKIYDLAGGSAVPGQRPKMAGRTPSKVTSSIRTLPHPGSAVIRRGNSARVHTDEKSQLVVILAFLFARKLDGDSGRHKFTGRSYQTLLPLHLKQRG